MVSGGVNLSYDMLREPLGNSKRIAADCYDNRALAKVDFESVAILELGQVPDFAS